MIQFYAISPVSLDVQVFMRFFLFFVGLISSGLLHAASSFRQPAYITNAYFSDKMTEEENELLRPLAVVKALRSRTSGVVGYLVLDLLLVDQGEHHFKVNILNPQGEKVTDLVYPPVHVSKQGDLPLYTAAGAVSGSFYPGIWFFKVFDQVDSNNWSALGTFSIMVLDMEQVKSSDPKMGIKEDAP